MFQFKRDDNAAAQASMGGGVPSGVHDVVIKGAYIGQTKNGNNTVDLELETATGAKCIVFGMCIDEKWASGSENSSYATWQELVAIADMKNGALTPVTRKVRKQGVESEEQAQTFAELTGRQFKMLIRVVKDVKQDGSGTFTSRELMNTFLPDGRTIAERNANSTAKKIEKAKGISDKETKAYKAFQGGNDTTSNATINSTAPNTQIPAANAVGAASLL